MKHVIHLTQIEVEQAIRDYAAKRANDLGDSITNATGSWKLEILCDCPDGTQSSLHKVTAQIVREEKE